jgi:glycerol transport system ATP-binding protein
VFHAPQSLRVARAFSDPPMNLLPGTATAGQVQLAGGPALALAVPGSVAGAVTVGLRASALNVDAGAGDVALPGKVELAEISGSDTFVHVDTPVGELVAQLTGVHRFELGTSITLYFSASQAYVFDAGEKLALAPAWRKGSI